MNLKENIVIEKHSIFIFYWFPLLLSFTLVLLPTPLPTLDTSIIKYLIIGLITVQGSILALAISLSLIGAQLLTTKYPLRLIELFRENSDLWHFFIVFYIYIIGEAVVIMVLQIPVGSLPSFDFYSILFSNSSSISLEIIHPFENAESYNFSISFLGCIGLISCSLASFAFFFDQITSCMSSEKGFSYYVKDLFSNKKLRSNTWNESFSNITELSKFFSFFNTSITIGDLDTIQVGYSALFDKIMEMVEDKSVQKLDIHHIFVDLIEEIYTSIILSGNARNFKITKESVIFLVQISKILKNYREMNDTFPLIIEKIANTSVMCIKQAEFVLAIFCLNCIYEIKLERFPLDIKMLDEPKTVTYYCSYFESLSIIGKEAVRHENHSICYSIIENITEIWNYYQKDNLSPDICKFCLNTLGEIGSSAIQSAQWFALEKITDFLNTNLKVDKIDSVNGEQLIETVVRLLDCSIQEKQSYLTTELVDILENISDQKLKCSLLSIKWWGNLSHLLMMCMEYNLKEANIAISCLMGQLISDCYNLNMIENTFLGLIRDYYGYVEEFAKQRNDFAVYRHLQIFSSIADKTILHRQPRNTREIIRLLKSINYIAIKYDLVESSYESIKKLREISRIIISTMNVSIPWKEFILASYIIFINRWIEFLTSSPLIGKEFKVQWISLFKEISQEGELTLIPYLIVLLEGFHKFSDLNIRNEVIDQIKYLKGINKDADDIIEKSKAKLKKNNQWTQLDESHFTQMMI